MQEALSFGPAQIVLDNLGEVKGGNLELYKVRILFEDSVSSLYECDVLTSKEASRLVSSFLDSAVEVVRLTEPRRTRHFIPESGDEKKQKADEKKIDIRYALGKIEAALGLVFRRNPEAVTRDNVNRIVDFGCSGVTGAFYGNEQEEALFPFLRKAIAAKPVALTYALERAVAIKLDTRSSKRARRCAASFLNSASRTLGREYKPQHRDASVFPPRKPELMLRYLP